MEEQEFIKVFEPKELGELYTHWPELTPEKIKKISTREQKRFKVFDRIKGRDFAHEVFNVCPILVTPFLDGYMILNGKHRAYLSYKKGYKLISYLVYTPNDIMHRVPLRILGIKDQGFSKEDFCNILSNKEFSYRLCSECGKAKVKQLEINYKMPDEVKKKYNID